MSKTLIRNGTVVDGTGAAGFAADVRVHDGVIAEVAPGLTPAADETVVDATGCIVSPGFIESHTHFDGAMWWDEELDPLPGYGVTSLIMGNCGFSVAPVSDDEAARREVVGIFSFFEDIPEQPFLKSLPWDWRSWPEYRDSMVRNVKLPANYAAFCGHIALRLAVMGLEAWDRAATAAEVEQMCALLDEALAAGALGMSTNLFDHDGEDRPVPSLQADDHELQSLMAVISRHPGSTLQVIVDTFRNMTAPDTMRRIAKLSEGMPLRVQWAGLPTLVFQRDMMGIQAPLVELHEQFKREGRDFWTGYAHIAVTSTLSVQSSLIFAQSNDYVWHEVVTAEGDAAKEAVLRDPDWRARARESWDTKAFEFSPFPEGRAAHLLLMNSDNGVGPTHLTLGEYQEQIGAPHPSDAMAEWLLANGLQSTVTMPPFECDRDMVLSLMRDPYSVGNISDAGAHGQMLCGGGENVKLFTDFVRSGDLTVEEAVYIQTGKLANHFGFHDRGVLQAGKRADLTVFNLDEVQEREMKRVYDVPDGKGGFTWRWSRDAAPMRMTMVNGEVTFDGQQSTPARPGEMLAPSVAA
ncbi:amidohydrolase family protein [Haliea sp.]|jgi:N-acyl-D-amino-acid deacylase|uniref:N-acyl-D-amino-acid deacylase family protein n=1 Tax=Haliea TaxID=475794 RepID=UPI000C53A97F|nr:amidohydrolase family protein [Haliea sp.]HBX72783.1 amidohydrolase [Halieaceae bacterium]MAD63777.1 amidohydrolase [Haliea sp.]MAY92138.1 amidohydrolase [Haliea sp.]MBK42062.1 amidohydrolase [Haliea sp.]MBP69878.1 amidohydrolase [Haliea sp.]|tara:strand:+ start:69430 stop:71163 length:1734 start_codon:yes stop_codon:yes gene_type:complete